MDKRLQCWETIPYFTLIALIVLYVSMWLIILNPSIWHISSVNTLLPKQTVTKIVLKDVQEEVTTSVTIDEEDTSSKSMFSEK